MTCLAIGVAIGSQGLGDVATYTVTITGLTSGEARPGDHASIGFTTDPVGGTITQRWGSTLGGSEYGTGSAPTDYTAGDGGTLYLEVTRDGEVVRASALIRYAAGSVTETGTPFSWTIDDTTLNVNFASDFTTTNLTGSYVITGLPTGGIDDTDGTASGTLTGTPSSGNVTVTFTDQYGREIVGTYAYTTAYRTQATGGADLDLSFVEDSAITSTDLTANWTENGNTLTYAITGTALPAGLSVSSAGAMTGTPTTPTADATYTLRGTDEYGRTTDDTFTLEITENLAVNPVFTLGTQTAGSGGSADSIAVSAYSYGGADDLDLYIATGASSFAITEAQLIAGSGGAGVEFANVTGYTGGAVSLTGLTDDTVVEVAAVLVERANGGSSGITRATLTDIDFTPLGFTSAEATDANTVVVTLNDTVLPTSGNTGTWAFNIAGSPATVTGAAVSGSTVTLTVSDTMTSGQTLNALAYTPGNLTDERGNAMVAFSGQSITNSVPAVPTGPVPTFMDAGPMGSGTAANSFTTTAMDTSLHSGTDDIIIGVHYHKQSSGTAIASVTVDGNSATVISGSRRDGGTFNPSVEFWRITGVSLGSTSDVVVTFNSTNTGYLVTPALWSVSDVTSIATKVGSGSTSALTFNVVVADDDAIIAISQSKTGTAGTTWTGVTEDYTYADGTSRPATGGSISGLTANATYTVATTYESSSPIVTSILVIS